MKGQACPPGVLPLPDGLGGKIEIARLRLPSCTSLPSSLSSTSGARPDFAQDTCGRTPSRLMRCRSVRPGPLLQFWRSRTSSRKRLCFTGRASSTMPPPMVVMGENCDDKRSLFCYPAFSRRLDGCLFAGFQFIPVQQSYYPNGTAFQVNMDTRLFSARGTPGNSFNFASKR